MTESMSGYGQQNTQYYGANFSQNGGQSQIANQTTRMRDNLNGTNGTNSQNMYPRNGKRNAFKENKNSFLALEKKLEKENCTKYFFLYF